MIETERLVLRPFEPADHEALRSIYSREEVATYLYDEAMTDDEIRALLDKRLAARGIAEEGDRLSFAVIERSTGGFVGDVVLAWTSRLHRSGEIGFVFHPDHQGRGYATEAATELLRIAFEQIRLHRVVARTEARNVASARVMEKLGMRREAHLVENEWVKDEWQSELIYAILDREWEARRSPPGGASP
jgi:RimJ/RimL family protein N-acetyltransferase